MKIHELTEEQFTIALNQWAQNIEFDADFVIDEFKRSMEPYVKDMDIRWSGFWSQGDGASFSGSVNLLAVLDYIDADNNHYLYRELMRAGELWQTAKLSNTGHYCHEGTMNLEDPDCYTSNRVVSKGPLMGLDLNTLADSDEYDANNKIAQLVQAGADEVLAWLKDQARELYKELEQEYEYQTSKEQFIEWAEANEVEFDYEEA